MRVITFFLCLFLMSAVAFAGTFTNISDQNKGYINVEGQKVTARPGENATTYDQLDILDPSSWKKVDEEPYTPLAVYDQDVELPANSTIAVAVEVETQVIQVWNIGTVDVKLSLNTADNPYPVIIKQATTDNNSDYLSMSNNKTIHSLFFKNLSTTTVGKVKIRVIP